MLQPSPHSFNTIEWWAILDIVYLYYVLFIQVLCYSLAFVDACVVPKYSKLLLCLSMIRFDHIYQYLWTFLSHPTLHIVRKYFPIFRTYSTHHSHSFSCMIWSLYNVDIIIEMAMSFSLAILRVESRLIYLI